MNVATTEVEISLTRLRMIIERDEGRNDFNEDHLLAAEKIIRGVRKFARENNVTLKELGTSQNELDAIETIICKPVILNLLKGVREGKKRFWTFYVFLKDALQKKQLAYEDIDTTMEEVMAMKRNHHKENALAMLESIRNPTSEEVWSKTWDRDADWLAYYTRRLNYVLEEAAHGKLSLSELGTSKEELATLGEAPKKK